MISSHALSGPLGILQGLIGTEYAPKQAFWYSSMTPWWPQRTERSLKNFAKYLSGLARFHTILAFPGISKRVFLVSEGPKRTFGEAQRFTYHKLIILIFFEILSIATAAVIMNWYPA